MRMRLGIKAKQVVGVTSIVGAVVVILSLFHLATLAHVRLEESRARAEQLANAVLQRAVVAEGADLNEALRGDPGLRSVLESAFLTKNLTFAAIADLHDVAVAHADPSLEGQPLPAGGDLVAELSRPALAQLRTIYTGQGRNLELRQKLFLGNAEVGSIRVGVSTLLVRDDLATSLAGRSTALRRSASRSASRFLARCCCVRFTIRSGLTRAGTRRVRRAPRPRSDDESGELGTFFNAVSAQLSADRSQMAGQVANLSRPSSTRRPVDGEPARRAAVREPRDAGLLPEASSGATLTDMVAPDHPLRRLAEQTLLSRRSLGPISALFQEKDGRESGERLIITHAVNDPAGELVGVMVIARNLEYLGQVQSTIRYSRKLAALGRLSAGVAHEVKNPLNAMMIHLELLRQQFGPARPSTGAGRALAARGELAEPRALAVVETHVVDRSEADQRLEGAGLSEIHPSRGPQAAADSARVAVRRSGADPPAGEPARRRRTSTSLRRGPGRQRRSGDAAPGVSISRSTPARRCPAARCRFAVRPRRTAASPSRSRDTGVGIVPEDLQRIFNPYHDQAEGQRDRLVDGVSHSPDARRRY
jgi:hypothetical protein